MSTELIRLMHEDAEEWCALDQEHKHERFLHWYSYHYEAVAAAFASAPGHKVVVTVPNLSNFDSVVSRLSAFADIVAVRDEIGPVKGEIPFVAIPDEQSKGEIERGEQLGNLLRQVDVGLLPIIELEAPWHRTSKEKKLSDGRIAHLVGAMNEMCNWHKDVFEWWEASSIRKEGRAIYAPFITTPEMEAEAIRQNFSIYASYDAFPLAVGHDPRIEYNHLTTLLSLEIPHLLSIDQNTLQKIRADHAEEFIRFRDAIFEAVSKVTELAGDEGYERKIRQIQRDLIEDPLNALRSEMDKVVKLNSMRQMGAVVCTGVTGLLAGIGAPEFITVGAAGAALIQLVESIKSRIGQEAENQKSRTDPMFFLWQVEQHVQD